MALNVRTGSFGAKFDALSRHIADKAQQYQAHEQAMMAEIAGHQGHAYGRHGYQAGWEAQLIRVVTSVTPDQTFAPTGVEAVIRQWNQRFAVNPAGGIHTVMSVYDATGRPQHMQAGPLFTPGPAAYQIAAGRDAGGFISPGKQDYALRTALLVAMPYIHVAASFHPGIARPWKDLDRCMVVVSSPQTGFGFSYSRNAQFVARTRDQVLALIEAMQTGKTRGDLGLPDTGAPLVDAAGRALRPEAQRPAFSGMGELLDYLGVDIVWQKSALVILKKDVTGNMWERVTMYPCNLAPQGWAPSLKVQNHPWSGKVRMNDGSERTFAPPAWTPQ